ncbi:MAG TPA: Ni/Fe-hydrogenase cytochrome b subunit [Longimicrobiales bacterium]|nr:Ni/Fe-hydrogenase cytochrome b subunit [Longimicrobiales bacterium]
MTISRRVALKVLAGGAAAAALPRQARCSPRKAPDPTAKAVLYDATRCIGCRECVVACAEANGWDPRLGLGPDPGLSDHCPTAVRRVPVARGDCFLKVQCMHCVEPACVSACMLGAMSKDDDGAVTWNGDLCVGCRYCQIACPFGVPRFEWDTPVPQLLKCELCPERRAQGLPPACVAQCRRGALTYGTRREILADAHRRIEDHPGRYNPKIYGETDGGGTSVLYMAGAGVSFAGLGFPDLGETAVAALPERIQHTIYRGFAAPLALLVAVGALVRRNSRRLREEEPDRTATEAPTPMGGRLVTPTSALLAAVAVVGFLTVIWRYVVGLGAMTNLSDGYPMGLWIAFDVVTGTALACGGYAMAMLVYLANRGRYHPLIRPALVTSALGYTLGGLSVLVDIGRPWNFYRIPTFFWHWNFNSILLEVALCIMAYSAVLWIELLPIFAERWRGRSIGRLKRFAVAASPRLERALPYLIAVGLVLPTMHQSSLGSLMLLAGVKLHPLWQTPLLPLLFLVSCVAMGYAAVTMECCISARVFHRPQETPMLRALALPVAALLLAYAVLRAVDVAQRGQLDAVTRFDGFSLLFLLEMALFIGPAVGLLAARARARASFLTAMAALVVLGGALYRFSTFIFAFRPGPAWSYHPSLGEVAVTSGFVAAEVLGYIILVKRFPVLRGVASTAAAQTAESSSSSARVVDEEPLRPDAPQLPWVRPSEEELHVLVDA